MESNQKTTHEKSKEAPPKRKSQKHTQKSKSFDFLTVITSSFLTFGVTYYYKQQQVQQLSSKILAISQMQSTNKVSEHVSKKCVDLSTEGRSTASIESLSFDSKKCDDEPTGKGCFEEARRMELLKPSESKVFVYYGVGCNKGYTLSCLKGADFAAVFNTKKSLEEYGKLCDNKVLVGCRRAAHILRRSWDEADDAHKKKELTLASSKMFQRSCDLGITVTNKDVKVEDEKVVEDCTFAAWQALGLPTHEVDYEVVKKYGGLGCTLGDKRACDFLKQVEYLEPVKS